MTDEPKKISKNRQKKMDIVANLNEKLAKSKAVVFTNYQGLTHKQIEGLKRAIKPLKAEFVVAKNSLVVRAMEENKIKVDDEKQFEGPTGTLLIYDDLISPLKEIAKLIKELGIPSIKFGMMDGAKITGEQVLKLSTLPTKEVLLSQLVSGLKSPIFNLHRALNWNLQKLVMTLNAVALAKPAIVASNAISEPAPAAEPTPAASEPASESAAASDAEPETILAETKEEKLEEQPLPTTDEVKTEGGEN